MGARAARLVRRAFDDALSQAGGSLQAWLVLLNLKIRPTANQRELAEAVGIREATLTHHLNAMETDGLLTRRRDHNNRRIHVVELTDGGEAAFLRLRDAAVAFDRRLRRGITARGASQPRRSARPARRQRRTTGRRAYSLGRADRDGTPTALCYGECAVARDPQAIARDRALTAATSILVDRDPPGAPRPKPGTKKSSRRGRQERVRGRARCISVNGGRP